MSDNLNYLKMWVFSRGFCVIGQNFFVIKKSCRQFFDSLKLKGGAALFHASSATTPLGDLLQFSVELPSRGDDARLCVDVKVLLHPHSFDTSTYDIFESDMLMILIVSLRIERETYVVIFIDNIKYLVKLSKMQKNKKKLYSLLKMFFCIGQAHFKRRKCKNH